VTAADEQQAVATADYTVEFGRRFAEARANTRLNQRQLATRLGVTKGVISNVEVGRRSTTAHNVIRYAAVLGVDAGWLLTGDAPDGQPQPPRQVVKPDALERVCTDLDRASGYLRSLAAEITGVVR
jgi:transcriptional regulator with XRE-family HTH domain